MIADRVITKYKGTQDGPLLITLGGMHGNEPAGVKAIEMMGKMLDVEPVTNPEFEYCGSFLGIIGNLKAYNEKKRYIKVDLNRSWTPQNMSLIESTPEEYLKDEQLEIKQILEVIDKTIEEYQPSKVIVLDLHTTSSFGGIFTITNDDPESLKIALELHAPVILGMLNGIKGTTLHYFTKENFNIDITAVTFESGQHLENLSINRAIAAITNCMRIIGCISPEHVENQHDKLLIEYSKNLPKISQLISKHSIASGEDFKMLPDFKNFQKLHPGQPIAETKDGTISAEESCRILMPLYQEQGEDGYFLIQEVS